MLVAYGSTSANRSDIFEDNIQKCRLPFLVGRDKAEIMHDRMFQRRAAEHYSK